jgi:hypothetical protein
MMKRLIALSGVTLTLLAATPPVAAQSLPSPLPALTSAQSADVQQRLAPYSAATQARVSRGEITPDEANRLVRWREWQLAQQTVRQMRPPGYAQGVPADYDARPADAVPPDYNARPADAVPPDYNAGPAYAVPPDYAGPPSAYYPVEPVPYYGPYYRYAAPYYWGPRPYAYWGPAVCAGGFGRHFGGRICF